MLHNTGRRPTQSRFQKCVCRPPGFAHDTNLSGGLRTGNGYIGLRPDNSENKGRKLPACEITKKGTHRVSNGCPFVHLLAAESFLVEEPNQLLTAAWLL